jgi:hypothetical protein
MEKPRSLAPLARSLSVVSPEEASDGKIWLGTDIDIVRDRRVGSITTIVVPHGD